MKLLKISFFCLLLASCNSPRAVYDYDPQAQFSQYDTYNIFPEFNSGLSQLDEQRLLNSLEKALQEEDLTEATNPNLYVNVYTEEFWEPSRNSLGVGVGGTGRNVGVGISGGIPLGAADTYLKLTFDFINVENDALVWQAVVESPFDFNANPEERQKRFDRIVEKALKGYPPGK